ncbi:MscS family membrane protein [Sulfurivirga caldicuralii]|uniref:MscS family membrane protein n=1 Tax=Sulfurivirga caldicuralii TaxID=364032 RepID=A0A1N6F138_9GAMM|nr:mechanosensitive ion channel family protein [Sulfurivirga caldicuralii]SIN88949.1 MscS family membrane protein [Sulfurivirga caldicuralii]
MNELNEFLSFLQQQWPAAYDAWTQLLGWFDGQVWLLLAALVLVGALVVDTVQRVIIGQIHRRWCVRHPWLDAFVGGANPPLSLAIWFSALIYVLMVTLSALNIYTDGFHALISVKNSVLTLLLGWYVIRVVGRLEGYLKEVADQDPRFDRTLVEALAKVIRLTAVVITGLIVLSAFGVNVTGLLAFGGAGGLVVGLAAKDMISNLFGGLTIYLDRPFVVGDWIRSPDKDIEGTVEHIGWRRTVIRRFNKNPLYVPNGLFTNIVVENPSRMSHRRIYEKFGVRYGDQDKVAKITADIRQMLQNHPDIDQTQTIIVNFNTFADSSLECFVYCFTRTTVWVEYHQVKEAVLLQIADIVVAHGAEMAFPSQSVYFETPLQLDNRMA